MCEHDEKWIEPSIQEGSRQQGRTGNWSPSRCLCLLQSLATIRLSYSQQKLHVIRLNVIEEREACS